MKAIADPFYTHLHAAAPVSERMANGTNHPGSIFPWTTATAFVIVNRLPMIQNADRIYVFEKGRVIEEGPTPNSSPAMGSMRSSAAGRSSRTRRRSGR